MKKLFLMLISICTLSILGAQELNVDVKILTPKLQTTDPKVFETLEQEIREYMNNQKWTDDEYEQEERIDVNIQITINKELDATTFEAELSIQASRPVYQSSYESVLLSHRDVNFKFIYEQYQPIQFTENSYNDNLSSMLSYYAYIILGMDYDSFEEFGGTPYFQKAQEILNNIPSGAAATFKGWRSLDGNRNRYWIIENLLSPRIRPYRQAMYNYHRHGLDVMHKDPIAGRAIMTQAIENLKDVNRAYPNSMILQMFSNAKRSEIIEIYAPARTDEKNKIVTTMSKVDAANASEYNNIRKIR